MGLTNTLFNWCHGGAYDFTTGPTSAGRLQNKSFIQK